MKTSYVLYIASFFIPVARFLVSNLDDRFLLLSYIEEICYRLLRFTRALLNLSSIRVMFYVIHSTRVAYIRNIFCRWKCISVNNVAVIILKTNVIKWTSVDCTFQYSNYTVFCFIECWYLNIFDISLCIPSYLSLRNCSKVASNGENYSFFRSCIPTWMQLYSWHLNNVCF